MSSRGNNGIWIEWKAHYNTACAEETRIISETS